MPLIVPALRLVMLFLNIYDSYKVLKPPPSSSRNANRPSLRAVTQRKRSMKGSLAVWVVWCCYIIYERLLESLVGLFIPFYNELKSLVIIFLILTRARGAEPIYLHIIRPFIKPYTESLDSVLDFMFLLCDIALATVGVPVRAACAFWKRKFRHGDTTSDEQPTDHNQSFSESGGERFNEPAAAEVLLHEPPATRSQLPKPMATRRTDSGSSSVSSHFRPKEDRPVFGQNTSSNAERKHEIWYPPLSAYKEDNVENSDILESHQRTSTSDSDATLVTVDQVDEWRLYPQFPAAYPPTPLVSLTRLSSKSDATGPIGGYSLHKIDEMSKQDFRLSLSPPPEALDPSSDGVLSDEKLDSGVHKMMDDDITMLIDPDASICDSSTFDEEEEDEFNTTLQTPLPAHVLTKAILHAPDIFSRTTSLATTNSIRSRSTGLSTVDNGSSLRTRTSLDSLSSAGHSSGEDSPVIGKKRPLPVSRNASSRNAKFVSGPGLESVVVNEAIGDERLPKRHAPFMRSSDHQGTRDDGSKVSEVKKRRLASPNKMAVRVSKPTRPRLARAGSPPARFQRKSVSEQAKPQTQARAHGAAALRTNRAMAGFTGNTVTSSATIEKSGPRRVLVPRGQERKFDENS